MKLSFLKEIFRSKLGRSILLTFFLIGITPIAIVNTINYLHMRTIVQNQVADLLQELANKSIMDINYHFNRLILNLNLRAESGDNVEILKAFTRAFKKSNISLERFVKSPQWAKISTEKCADLKAINEGKGYYDIFLIDTEGNILFSIKKESDLGTNLFNGKYSQTKFSKACKKVFNTGKPAYSDLEFYEPSGNEPVGFVIDIMYDDLGNRIGFIAFQIDIEQLNNFVQYESGRYSSFDTYLLGTDLKMRSNSLLDSVDNILKYKVSNTLTQQFEKEFQTQPEQIFEKTEALFYNGRKGYKVLGIYSYLEITGIPFILISEIKKSEIFYDLNNIKLFFIASLGMIIIFIFFLTIYQIKTIVIPIIKLSDWAKRVAIGDLTKEKILSPKNEIGEMANSFDMVVDSFWAISQVCQDIALGDFKSNLEIRSDKDDLSRYVNQMSEMLQDAILQAHKIAWGDYDTDVKIRSENDQLGKALEQMTITLKNASIETKSKLEYLNNIPTPFFVIDKEYNVLFITEFGADFIGKPIEKCVEQKCYNLFNTGLCHSEKCPAKQAMDQNSVIIADTISCPFAEKVISIRSTAAPLKDENNNIIGAMEYMIDTSVEQKVAEIAERISLGDLDINQNLLGSENDLDVALKRMIDRFKSITNATKKIVAGDYNFKIKENSYKDELARSINQMADTLKEKDIGIRETIWLNDVQLGLAEILDGVNNYVDISREISKYLCKKLDAQVGALYIVNDKEIKLMGSYAFNIRKQINDSFKVGEGLLGEVVLEKETILLENAPEDYFKISSGLGSSLPKNIIVSPFIFNNQVLGVIELGSFKTFPPKSIKLLNIISETVAVELDQISKQKKLHDLLEKTQIQSEKLQLQQEELKSSNEELQSTNERIKLQQEELRISNEELEDKTRSLEINKKEVEKKNRALERVRVELEKKAKELETSSKYKSEFLANMSHELRSPLNSLLLLAKALSRNSTGNLTEKQKESARIIYNSGNNLLSLINEILDLSKVESGKMEVLVEKLKLKDIQYSMEYFFRHQAEEKGIAFHINIDNRLPEIILTDKKRLEQIIRNLLSNAIKFTEKGKISFDIRKPEYSTGLFNSKLDVNNCIEFSVTDSGVGIPEKKQSIIFEAFQQADGSTSRKYGGTGLGLSITKELCKLLGGEIHLNSIENKGSTFSVFLPIKLKIDKEEQVNTDSNGKHEVIKTKNSKININEEEQVLEDDRNNLSDDDKIILIIEDDLNFAKIVLEMCNEKGFKCIHAATGEGGLFLAGKYSFDAIILDIRLPGVQGAQVLEILKDNLKTRHIPVMVMSAHDKPEKLIKKGACGFLSKPVSEEKLFKVFDEIKTRISKNIKDLLIIENDKNLQKGICNLLDLPHVKITVTEKGKKGLDLIKTKSFDCVILDLGLPDISGYDILKTVKKDKDLQDLPVIIYTGQELSKKEQLKLYKYADSVIQKKQNSDERLLDETTLFLHSVYEEMNIKNRHKIASLHDADSFMKGKKVLIVDDDMRNLFALTEELELKGLEVIKATNGQEALDVLKENPNIDIVLMDIMMPVMDGFEAIKKIREELKYSSLPILAVTAKAMEEDRQKCIDIGANDFLSKPLEIELLFSMMRVWIKKD